MGEVPSRELRRNTRQLLDRVAAGESIVITVDGRPVAELRPLEHRPRWIPRAQFLEDVRDWQADAGLIDELRPLSE